MTIVTILIVVTALVVSIGLNIYIEYLDIKENVKKCESNYIKMYKSENGVSEKLYNHLSEAEPYFLIDEEIERLRMRGIKQKNSV